MLLDDVDNDDDAALELEEAAASGVFPKKEKDELSVALAAVPEAPIRFSEVSKGGVNGSAAVTGQISANGLMIINENGEEERRTVTAIFAGAERCRRWLSDEKCCLVLFCLVLPCIALPCLVSLFLSHTYPFKQCLCNIPPTYLFPLT